MYELCNYKGGGCVGDDVIIKVGFNSELLRMGIRQYVEINLTKNPHL